MSASIRLDNVTALSQELCRLIEPDYGLVDELINSDVISEDDAANIRAENEVPAQNRLLLAAVVREGNDVCVQLFSDALRTTDQHHVYNFILHNGNKTAMEATDATSSIWPMDVEMCNFIKKNTKKLIEFLEVNDDVIAEMSKRSCLSDHQLSSVKRLTTLTERNKRIVDLLTRRSVANFQQFVDCVSATQRHLGPLLVQQYGEQMDADEMILTCEQLQRLYTHHKTLVDLIDVTRNELLDKLCTAGCLTLRQSWQIENDPQPSDVLLDVMTRRSLGQFNRFASCLTRTGTQHEVAAILLTEAAVVCVCQIRLAPTTDLQIADDIVLHFEQQQSQESLNSALQSLNIDVNDVKLTSCSQYVLLCYVICRQIHQLRYIHNSTLMTFALNQLFYELRGSEAIVSDLKWVSDDIEQLEKRLHRLLPKGPTQQNTGATQQRWIRGAVTDIIEQKGFGKIEALEQLPEGFAGTKVHFYSDRIDWRAQIGDQVEFILSKKKPEKPSACKIRRFDPTKHEQNDNQEESTPSNRNINGTVVTPSRRFTPLTKYTGKIKSLIKADYGFIKVSGLAMADVDMYFHFSSSHFGGFEPIIHDQVSFYVSERRGRLQAENVRFTKCVKRSADCISAFIEKLSAMEIERNIEELALAIMNVPVWDCIGQCSNMSDGCLATLLDLLIKLSEFDHLRTNFTGALEVLLNTELFKPNHSRFEIYVENVLKGGSVKRLKEVKEAVMVMVRLVPGRSKLLTKLIGPLVSTDTQSCENYLYQLLKQVVKGTASSVENMDWDDLPLVPSVKELFSTDLESSCDSLQPVLVEGPYPSAEEYLDIYFRLLRADCFSSLTKGIRDLLGGKLDPRDMNVYRGIRLAGIHLTQGGSGGMSIALSIQPSKRTNFDNASTLMYGNLLCISVSGTFRDPIWATVLHRELLKTHKIILVELCTECNVLADSETILDLYYASPSTIMVESPTYYRAYQPVLRSLQQLSPENMVFQDELVRCIASRSPEYIEADTTFNGNIIYPGSRLNPNVICYCLDETKIGNTSLDASQESSLKECLRNRMAIVQGPPGTGKTYVGIKLVEVIQSLSKPLDSPILVLTYKNHSLDEFLKDVLKIFPRRVARVGGRSMEPELAECSLSELCRSQSNKMSIDLFKQCQTLTSEITDVVRQLKETFDSLSVQLSFTADILLELFNDEQVREFLMNCEWNKAKVKPFKPPKDGDGEEKWRLVQNCVSADDVRKILRKCNIPLWEIVKEGREEASTGHVGKKLHTLLQAAVKLWLPNEQAFKDFERRFTQNKIEIGDYEQTLNDSRPPAETSSAERDEDETLLERLASSSHVNSTAKDILEELNLFHSSKDGAGHLLKIAKELSSQYPLSTLLSSRNIWELNETDRILLVQCVLHRKFESGSENFEELYTDYQRLYKSKEELRDQHKASILQRMKIVGMTITGANINRGLIAQIRPAVVLVEEAAEVLEPQLVAVLGPWTKHLILIGDHKQLRPSVENYKIATQCHLDVSMMERLINNNLSYSTLTMQNRMRPEFAELLLDIYPKLQSNLVRVEGNLQATCIGRSMFFWSHSDEETCERSYTNTKEADRVLNLALFLIEQGYKPCQITLLSPYLGQVRLLRKKVKEAEQKYVEFFAVDDSNQTSSVDPSSNQLKSKEVLAKVNERSIKVHTVDLYQGDENDFVIVSLVRSNTRGDIGFVKLLNRRCVAQSRSRCGLYFVGNLETFVRHRFWKPLLDGMAKSNCVGNAMPLHCPNHPTSTVVMAATADQIPLKKTFCTVVCKLLLPCGHVCMKTCQPRHNHAMCKEIVTFRFPACYHVGSRECYRDESKEICCAIVPINFEPCGHYGQRKCHQKPHEVKCSEPCTKQLRCNHPCEKSCGEPCDESACKYCERIREEKRKKQLEEEEKRRQLARKDALEILEKIKQQNPDDTVTRCDLLPTGDTAEEYFSVEDRVMKYIQQDHNWRPTVARIEKVTNLKLEMKWLKTRSEMFDPTRSELKFHGTSLEAVENIIKDGFRLPKWDRQMFGAGIYFATDSSKSAQQIYTKGSHMLLVCEVLLGRSMTAETAMPRMTAKTLKEGKYDSLYAKRGTKVKFDEFVVYQKFQAIPRYIVRYQLDEVENGNASAGNSSPSIGWDVVYRRTAGQGDAENTVI